MTDTSPTLSLPYILPAQAQKHVTHNEALDRLDLLVQLVVDAFDATTPPGEPTEGTAFAIGAGAGGDWAGFDHHIAYFQNGGWVFVYPKTGWCAASVSGSVRMFNGSDWIDTRGLQSIDNLPGLGVGASSDATNKLAVASDATLMTHAGAGHQMKINKASASDTASILFQSGWTGFAEMGLAGSTDFSIKTSPDGWNWQTAMYLSAHDNSLTTGGSIKLTPISEPNSPQAGQIYFDSGSSKLRCFDGAQWHDLF